MNPNRKGLFAALVASATLSVAGCNAAQFNAVNDTFKDVKIVSTTAESSTLPAAAVATNMAIVELMNGLNADASGKPSSYRVLAGEATAVTSLKDGYGNLTVTRADGKELIQAVFKYAKEEKDGKLTYSVKRFNGLVSGYALLADGSFTYTAGQGGAGARMAASVTGKLGATTAKMLGDDLPFKGGWADINELAFDTPVPLKGTIEKIGSLKLVDSLNGNILSASASMTDNVVQAKGSLTKANGDVIMAVTMDENGIKTETAKK